jgi:uncharacterized protein YkwD
MKGLGIVWIVLLCGVAAQAAAPVALKPWWTKDQFQTLTKAEDRIAELVNAERDKAGRPALKRNDCLAAAARQHAVEMAKENYFSHDSPHALWRHAHERVYRAGYWEAYVAENIVYYMSSAATGEAELAEVMVHGDHGWMNSPPHRANILNKEWDETGLGVAAAEGGHKWYACQLFGRRYWDVTGLTLAAAGDGWVLGGRARLLQAADPVYLGRDDQILDTTHLEVGQSLDFKLAIPLDGAVHKLGLHPGKGGDSYWLKFQWWIDTSKPLDQALAMTPAE